MGTYYGPSWMKEIYYGITDTKNWLYGEWNEEKYNVYLGLSNIPVFNNYMDYLLDSRDAKQYLQRYGMGYSDIRDPRKLNSTSSGSRFLGSTVQFVSKNLEDLYN